MTEEEKKKQKCVDLRGKQHQQHYRVIGESRVAGTLHDKEMVKGNRDPPNIKLKRVLNLTCFNH